MPGDTCVVCGNTRVSDPDISLHRFPSDPARRQLWLRAFHLSSEQVKPHFRVCSRHFPGADPRNDPEMNVGKRFASPRKKHVPRAKRAKMREVKRQLAILKSPSPASSSSRCATPATPSLTSPTPSSSDQESSLTSIGEQLLTDYQVHELPSVSGEDESTSQQSSSQVQPSATERSEVLVNTALLARIEVLEAENRQLKSQSQIQYFRISQIRHSDKLVRFFTGFVSYMVFIAFFEFLGPAVNELTYWGSKESRQLRRRKCKLDPENQLFLTLIKLKLNLRLKDLAFRFGISQAVVSRYFTTWVCFLYHHLREIDWVPPIEQVSGTLPYSFREKYPTTYAIIDGTEIFIETPSDLHLQSSTWSSYKHHNTGKFLVACTPNGAICYVSPLYVGSISDIELTRVSGFLTTLQDKPGISIMADRGFTIKDMLHDLGIDLNLPPFMEGRKQLPANEVQRGKTIASLRIHVERAIGRIKTYSILQGTLPITLARLSNQIVCVCAYLSNFQPALVPGPEPIDESDVDEYFQGLHDSSSDSDLEYYGDDETSADED